MNKHELAMARTYWALERTWLAYVRACIAMGILGLSILKLTEYHDAGVMLNLAALLLFLWSSWWCASRAVELNQTEDEDGQDA